MPKVAVLDLWHEKRGSERHVADDRRIGRTASILNYGAADSPIVSGGAALGVGMMIC